MGCVRCGSEGHMEYGSDGLSYCSSCIFYGLNKPCWKCRMYLPNSELQMYRGQLCCQYCMMDLKDAERRLEESVGHVPGESKDQKMEERYAGERCERCGKELSTVYIYHGKALCSVCVEEQKKDWGETGGERPPMMMFRIREKKGALSSIVEAIGNRIAEARGKASAQSASPPSSSLSSRENKSKTEERQAENKGNKEKNKENKEKEALVEGPSQKAGLKYELEGYKDIAFEAPVSMPRTSKEDPLRKGKTKNRKSSRKKGEPTARLRKNAERV